MTSTKKIRWSLPDSGPLQIIAQVSIAFALYFWAYPEVFRVCWLSHTAYESSFIFGAAFLRDAWWHWLLLSFLPLVVFYRRIAWDRFDATKHARWYVWIVAGTMAITFAFADFNFYFNQAYLIDRTIVVLLWIAILLHPAFLAPFIITVLTLAMQVHYPLADPLWNWPDKRLPVILLFAICSYFYTAILLRPSLKGLLYVVVLITGSFYVHAGLSKVLIGPEPWTWLLEDHISNMIVAAYKNGGWLRNLSEAQVVSIAKIMERGDLFIAGLTLATELGAVFLFAGNRIRQLILAGAILLHFGILVTSGIFFWQWMVADAALIWLSQGWANQMSPPAPAPQWSRVLTGGIVGFILGVCVIAFATRVELKRTGILFAWWDSRMSNYFEIRAETESGTEYRIDPRFFSPYEVAMVQSRFYYLLKRPVLVGTYGAAHNYSVMKSLQTAKIEDVYGLTARMGNVYFSMRDSQALAMFVRTFLVNVMKAGEKAYLPEWMPPPYHFQTMLPADRYYLQSKVTKVNVWFYEHFYDGHRIYTLTPTLAATIQF